MPDSWLAGYTLADVEAMEDGGESASVPDKGPQPRQDAIAAECRVCRCPLAWEDHDGLVMCWRCTPPPVLAFVANAFLVVFVADSRHWLYATHGVLGYMREIRKKFPQITAEMETFKFIECLKRRAKSLNIPIDLP